MARDTASPLHTVGEENSAATPDLSAKGDTADQYWLEVSDRKFWRFLVPTLIFMIVTVTAAAFYIVNQGWITTG